MATINKQSVRNEFDHLKSNFKQLVTEDKVSSECQALFNGLIVLFELILAIFLEKTTKKTSRNSGLPPSQTGKDDSALGKLGSKGKGTQTAATQLGNTRTVETVEVIEVTHCDQCGTSLKEMPCDCVQRRTRIDILFEKTVQHIDAQIKTCPNCQATVTGCHPVDRPGPLQYGPGIQAYVVQLLVTQMLSLKRAQQLLATLIGQTLSEATLLSYLVRLYHILAPWEAMARRQLLKSTSMHVDETGLRVDKKTYWIHSYSATEVTLKCLHRKRGKEAMEGIGLIPNYQGVLIHDCWASYLSYEQCQHGLCGAHLLRELTFIMDAHGYRWAKQMKSLLKSTCTQVSQSPKKSLEKKDYARLQKRYRTILTQGKRALPALPSKREGRRGRLAKSDAHNLWERLAKHEQAVLRFAQHPEVSFTNNRAERDLRMDKVKQKVSGCFRTERYAKVYCRISSYLKTMANQGDNPIVAVYRAFSGEIYTAQPP